MRAFHGLVIKEFRHILRDWQTLLILIGMPVVQVVLFGYAVRSDVRGIPVAFVEPEPDHATSAIRARFAASSTFSVQGRVAQIGELEERFRDGSVRQAIVFPPRLAADIGSVRTGEAASIQIVTDGSDPNTGAIMEADAKAILRSWESDYRLSLPTDIRRASSSAQPMLIDVITRMRFNPTLSSVNLFVPGLIAYVLIIVSALMTAITIVREKELGAMEMLLISPLRPFHVVVGKLAPYVLLAFLDVILVLAVSRMIFGVPVRGSTILLLAESLLYIMTALAMGILISTSVSTQRVALLAALAGLMLPTLLLSGFIFPISALPLPLQILSNAVPARWFVTVVRGIMLKGAGLTELWKESLILAGMTGICLYAGIRRLAVRLD